MQVARRAAAAVALGALLACSGLGFCWKQFAASTHDCCASDSTMASVKSCASEAAPVAVVSVVAPSAFAPLVGLEPVTATSSRRPAAAFAPAFPVKSSPLILRL